MDSRKNSTLEKLSPDGHIPSDDDGALRHAMHFHFLAPNSLVFDSNFVQEASYASAFD
jgi:hypothetical protein